MKIALISYEYPPDTASGGIGTYTFQAAACLVSRGHAVEVFAASPRREGLFHEDGLTLNLTRASSLVAFAEELLPAFTVRHALVNFDVVESPDFFSDGRAVRAAFPKLPHVVKLHTPLQRLHELAVADWTLRGSVHHHLRQIRAALGQLARARRPRVSFFRPQRQLFSSLELTERDNAASADLVVSPSTSLGQWAAEKWKIDPRRIRVVPYPYCPAPGLLKIALDESPATVGYFGRLEHRKGIEDLAAAIPLVLRNTPEARFRFVGGTAEHPGTLEPYDAFLRRRLGPWLGSLELTGKVPLDTMPDHYVRAGICVIPSIWENFPNVCLEAMAAGRAIVATSGGGMEEMLDAGQCGVLVPPRSSSALAEAIGTLLNDPNRRAQLGTLARARLLKTYGYDVVGPQLEASYAAARSAAGTGNN